MKKLSRPKKIAVILSAAIVCASIFPLLRYYNSHRSNLKESITLYVESGTEYAKIDSIISPYLKNPNSFRKCAKRQSLPTSMKPGRYRFQKGESNIKIIRAIKFGWESPMNLTLSGNIRGLERLCSILGERLMYDSTTFSNYFNSQEAIERYNFNKETFISLFIPNTYSVYWTITPEEFLERSKREYDAFWNSERLEKAKRCGLSPIEVSILASIVCEESNYQPELKIIAGVYMNRIKRGMKLEADPTVKFALNDPTIKRILYKHLTVDSPYNTYKHTGLPPGPITIPQVSGIDAVLNYQEHNYLYFCASDKLDGKHLFATNLSEHNRNARKYQRAISSMAR